MTFVAQPYEHFVDDLLTALTGGMTREEHQFTGIDETYLLASPDILPFSLKVFGQRNEQFLLFERALDYEYDAKEAGIVWKPDERHPDDHSFFYVNYYLREGKRQLTDRNPGSVTTILCESFAREFAVLHKQMEMIYQSAFVDHAEKSSLDHVAALLSLRRKDARFAGGEVLFKRSTPAPAGIEIPAGIFVSTDLGTNFETTVGRTLRKGQLSVVVPVRAQVEGLAGQVETGQINVVNRPIFGIDSVTNEEGTFFANEKETDSEFRLRIKGTLERAGKSTLNAIKYALVEDIPEITEGNLQVTERADVPGTVDVKFGLGFTPDPTLIRRIEKSLFDSRAAGIRIQHNLPTRTRSHEAGLAVSIPEKMDVPRPAESSALRTVVSFPQKTLQQMPEGVLQLRVNVLFRLIEENVSVSEKEKLEDELRRRVQQYIDRLPMGEDLIYNKLLAAVVEPEEVADADIVLGPISSSLEDEFHQCNINSSGRKATISQNDIFVGLMDSPVHIDVLVAVEPKAGQGSEVSEVSQKLDASVRQSVEDFLSAAISAVDGGIVEITRTDLEGKIRAVLSADDDLQLMASGAVIVNAEYEDSGRLLNRTEQIALEENHAPRLRMLRIDIKGALDG